MATDSDAKREEERPCCALWKARLSKVIESRIALRQAVKILEQQIDKVQVENENLKKAFDEERARAELEVEAKLKESAIRVELENEISSLKCQITTLQETNGFSERHEDNETVLLQTRVSEAEVEINQLKEFLEKEKKRGELEKKKAEEKKKKASEAWKLLKSAKSKSEEEKRLADIERSRADEYRRDLEALRAELNEAKEELVSSRSKTEETLKNLVAEKQKAEEEKKRADIEMDKAEKDRKLIEEERKKVVSEKSRSNKLSQELAEQKRKNGVLEKELQKTASALKKANRDMEHADIQMRKVEEDRKLMEEERKKAITEKNCLSDLSQQLEEEKQRNEALKKEIERLKVDRKMEKARSKEHTDLESEIAEELRRSAEEERAAHAIGEKNHFNKLAQQLEVERQRNVALEKEMQGIMSDRQLANDNPVMFDHNGKAANDDMVILKKQLKLEKVQAKHAKRVAKLRKVQNDIMKKEIYCLRENFIQLSQRFSRLDAYFFPSNEGIDASVKLINPMDLHSSKLKTEYSGKERCAFYCPRKSKLAKVGHTDLDGFDHLRSELGHAGPYSGECCCNQNSGISSELESIIGNSVRSKSQNSIIYSTSTSFSDRQLVESQGRGAFSLSNTANLTKESQQGIVPKLSSEATEMSLNENFGVVAEDNVRSLVGKNMGNPCLNSEGPVGISAADGVSKETRKTMAFREALKSIEYVYFKDKKMSGHIEKNISALSDMFILKSKTPSRRKRRSNSLLDGEGLVSACGSDLGAGNHIPRKKRNELQKQNPILQPCNKSDGLDKSTDMITDSCKDVELFTQSMSPINCSKIVAQVCRGRAAGSVKFNQENQTFPEDMVNGNYMKLLELDNATDEERFRIAVNMPLSPTLPEIGMPDHEICWMTHFEKQREVPNEDNLVGSGSSGDKMEADISQTCLGYSLDADAATEITKGLLDCGNKEMIISCTTSHNLTLESFAKYCIVLENTEDKISKIISTMEICISQSFMVLCKDWVMDKIILALSKQQDLLPTERACVFLSLLLHNFSVVTPLKSNDLTSNHSLPSDSFAMHVNKVMSDGDVARLLLDLCLLDDLFHIIENFLVDRRILMYSNASHDTNVPSDSGSIISLRDGTAIYISMVAAAVDQLVAGSIILASMCSSFGRIGFVCEASYRILRTNISGSYLPLTVLHVFASLCGEQYFILNEYGLIMTAIKSIVMFLERGDKAGCTCSGALSTYENLECVFSKDAVSLDEVTGLLLEKLQFYAVPDSRLQFFENLSSSECSTSHYMEIDVCGSNSVASKSYTEFGDILSLLELVACYMSWEWTWSKIIPRLVKVLDSCMCEKFLAGLIVLLGQIWRHGVDSSGNLLVGAEELRQKLFSLLDQSTRKLSMSAQCAIVQALIAFDKIDFEELIQYKELQADTNQSDNCNLIRTWFFKLGAEQRSLLFSFFQTANLHER